MPKVLVIFAHPALEKSRIHCRMLQQIKGMHNVTLRDLYEEYPDFDIDVAREQQLLLEHDVVVFQHPFYWYSSPAIIKEWQDLVLEHQWAYGSKGKALEGKRWMQAISCGGSRQAYSPGGLNQYTIHQLLTPFERTASLCNMHFLPPFVVHGTHRISETQMNEMAGLYRLVIAQLAEGSLALPVQEQVYINDLVTVPQP